MYCYDDVGKAGRSTSIGQRHNNKMRKKEAASYDYYIEEEEN